MSNISAPLVKKTVPLRIEFVEQDIDGITYKIEALHVTTTKNRRRYTKQELERAARSLSWRPLNINHNDAAMLPYPENQTLETDFDATKNAVTGRMRIADEAVNSMIKSGKINRLSIEQLPVYGETCDTSSCEQHGVTFVGLALLTSDITPGDGSTTIVAESVSKNQEFVIADFVVQEESVPIYSNTTATTASNFTISTSTTANNNVNATFTIAQEEVDSADSSKPKVGKADDDCIYKSKEELESFILQQLLEQTDERAELEKFILDSLKEFNDCHTDGTGKFCADGDSNSAGDSKDRVWRMPDAGRMQKLINDRNARKAAAKK